MYNHIPYNELDPQEKISINFKFPYSLFVSFLGQFKKFFRNNLEKGEEIKEITEKIIISEKDHIRGNFEAPVTIVEYSDFQCPFCQRFHPTLQQILADYPDKVRGSTNTFLWTRFILRPGRRPKHLSAFGTKRKWWFLAIRWRIIWKSRKIGRRALPRIGRGSRSRSESV